jgi:hypothetical protein
MKKLIVALFFIGLVNCLEAQSSSGEFYVDNVEYADSFSTRDEFVQYTDMYILYMNGRVIGGRTTYARLVRQLTDLEEQLVSIAVQQLPKKTSMYSAWLVNIAFKYMFKTYTVYIYCHPDGKKYYRLIRLTAG